MRKNYQKEYPFKDRIREIVADRGKTLGWLFGEINKSESWFRKTENFTVWQLSTVEEISAALDYDFLLDYLKWKNPEIELAVVKESIEEYKKEPEMSIQLTIKGGSKNLTKNLGSVLEAIMAEGEKVGLKVGVQ